MVPTQTFRWLRRRRRWRGAETTWAEAEATPEVKRGDDHIGAAIDGVNDRNNLIF